MYSSSNVVKLFGSVDDDQSLPPDHSANPENMALGHIKLFRSLQTCHFSDEPEVFSTWVHMLMLCTHKPVKTRLGRKVITLLPGQFISGRKQLAQKVGVTEKQMRNIIALFEAEEMLSKDASRAGTVFTILKYAAYQGGDLPENKGQQKGPT